MAMLLTVKLMFDWLKEDDSWGAAFYLSGVFTLVRDNADPTEIVEYLTTVVEQRMGIAAQPDRTRRAVDVMIEWRKWIWDIKSDP